MAKRVLVLSLKQLARSLLNSRTFLRIIHVTIQRDFVFNVDKDETGLYWKKLPSRNYILREEKSAPDFKL